MSHERRPVLVTTQYRGVFFGWLEGPVPDDPARLTLREARNCIYWIGCGGFLGLAAAGPNDRCRIGAEVESLGLYGITSVTHVTPEAAARWKEAPTWT